MAPGMPEADELRLPLEIGIITYGWAYPISLLQHAVPELEAMGPDLGALQRRRDLLVSTLREQGYEAIEPEGTFYILVRSPLADDERFAELLRSHDVFVLPVVSPAVPEGLARLRATVTAAHEPDEISHAIEVIAAAGKKLGIIQ